MSALPPIHRAEREPAQVVPFIRRELPTRASLLAPLTPLLGREREVAVVTERLRNPDVRLVTLTGAGGVGKTRLALAVAAALRTSFTDGAAVVPLAAIADPALVLPAIAATLGVREAGERSILEQVQIDLRDRHVLLVLDNLEHLLDAAPSLVELLAACPDVKALVTSRAALRVTAEQQVAVPPLAVPKEVHSLAVETMAEYAAVALFVQRAVALRPDFALSAENALAVVEICRRLDGLPLAIELAAARINVLPPQSLLARLTNRLTLLTGGARDQPARLQTMRDAIAWSRDLLSPEEQALLRRLAVFVGGFSLELADAVIAAMPEPNGDVLDGVASLVDQSLVQPVDGPAGQTRYSMLETIREFGLEQLTASGEEQAARTAHAMAYLALAREADWGTRGPEQSAWLARIEAEQDNLRAAIEWAIEHNSETALHLVHKGLFHFWYFRGLLSEGRRWLDRVLARTADQSTLLRAGVLIQAGQLAVMQADQRRAAERCEEAIKCLRRFQDHGQLAYALMVYGNAASLDGDLAAAQTRYAEALTLFRAGDDTWGTGIVLSNLRMLASAQSDYDRAETLGQEALRLMRGWGDRHHAASTLSGLAAVALARGNLDRAEVLFEEAIAEQRQLGDKQSLAGSLAGLAQLARRHSDRGRAAALLDEALALARDGEDPFAAADVLVLVGDIAHDDGDDERAAAMYHQSLGLWYQHWHPGGLVACLERIASLAAIHGKEAQAAELSGAVAALRERKGVVWSEYLLQSTVPGARAYPADTLLEQGGSQRQSAAWRAGRSLPLEEVIAKGLRLAAELTKIGVTQPPACQTGQITLSRLSPRELEVLRLVAEGRTDQQIAEALFISRRTVTSHTGSILNKLGLPSRTAAAAHAVRQHLI